MHAKPARTRKRARASTRRKTVRWSNREVEALLAGVRTHGVGKWARILRHSPVFNGVRTSVDLKDKWRNLTSPVRAAALAGEAAPSPQVPQTPPDELPPPPTSARSHSTSEPPTRPPLFDAADEHASTPQPDSPKPLPIPVSEPTPIAADLPAPSSFLPTPPYPPITPYSVTQNIYHSAAAFAADYWRRFSHEAMYGMGTFSSIFPYVKHTPLLHTDDDDDDDDDDDIEVMNPPVYNPYNYAMAHMLSRVDHTTFAHTFPPQTPNSTIPSEPHASEGDSLQADDTNSDNADNLSVGHNAHAATSDFLCAENATTSRPHHEDAHTEHTPPIDRASAAEPAQCDIADGKNTSCSTGNLDHSILAQEQLFMPMQSA